MYQRRRVRLLLAVLTFVALVMVTIDVRAGADGLLSGTRGLATQVFRPVQDGVAFLVRPIGTGFGSVTELFSLRSENAQLRQRVAQLTDRRDLMADVQRENRELRRLLGMAERGAYETVAARAVSLSPSSFEWTITLDAGSDAGITRDMPVISGDGLVGRVVQVMPSSSRVLLAIDPNFFAAARTARTGETGLIEGRGSDPMVMRPLDPAADIAVGDEIVTSAYQGGVFPAGIPIGVVADIGDDTARLTREVTVLPFVDFTRVHHVLVVLSAPVEQPPPLVGTPGFEFTPPSVPRFIEPESTDDPDDGPDDEPDEAPDNDQADAATGVGQ